MDSVGEGEGGKIWENGIETCKISCMKLKKKKKEITFSTLIHEYSFPSQFFLNLWKDQLTLTHRNLFFFFFFFKK